jgi:hypothetical protein
MTRIVIDQTLEKKLHDLTEAVELCGESGRVLGCFVPKLDMSQYEPLEPQITKGELLRRKQSNQKRYTTAEVLAHFEKL